MPAPRQFLLGPRSIDLDVRQVVALDGNSAPVGLTELETRLLGWLVGRPEVVVSKATLLAEVWGYASGVQSRAVDYTLRRLRQKVEDDPSKPVHLVGVYGGGIALRGVDAGGADKPTGRPPSPRDPFVARRPELDLLRGWLDDGARLVSVLGPGGVGKTRLLLELLRDDDTVPWVSAGAVHDVGGLKRAVAEALGREDARVRPAVADRCGRVVLDEVEGCLDAVRDLLPDWLDAAPKLQWVVSSRSRLALPDELPLRLSPLSTKDARRLYTARAAAAGALHALHDLNAPGLDHLIDRLDGLPLTIELAAARAGVRTVAELVDALDDPLDTLADPDGRSLRSVVAWSWRLLPEDTADVLARCAVFPGEFSLSAAEAVAGSTVRAHLDALRDHSLLTALPGARRRFRISVAVRQFAREKLPLHTRDDVDQALLAWALRHTGHGQRGSQRAWIHDELEMLRALLERLVAHHPQDAARLATALAQVLADRGLIDEGLAALAHSSEPAGRSAVLRGRLLGMVGRTEEAMVVLGPPLSEGTDALKGAAHLELAELAIMGSRLAEARQHLDDARRLLAEDPHRQAWAAGRLCTVLRMQGDDLDRARSLAEQAVEEMTRLEDPFGQADARVDLALTLRALGETRAAREHVAAALHTFEALGSLRRAASLHVNLGVMCSEQGDRALALRHYRTGLALHQRTGNRRGAGIAWLNLAATHFWRGETADAEAALSEAGLLAEQLHDRRQEGLIHGIRGIGRFVAGEIPAAIQALTRARTVLCDAQQAALAGWFATYEGVARAIQGQPTDACEPLAAVPALVAAARSKHAQDGHLHAILDNIGARARACEDGRYLVEWLRERG